MMTIKTILGLFVFGLLFLGACSPEKSPKQEEVTESKEAIAKQKLAVGKSIYETNCAGCHDSDVAGAPKPGDKADWKNRMQQGHDIMAKKAIQGMEGKRGVMPPKGGNDVLTDEEVTSAVNYMISLTK